MVNAETLLVVGIDRGEGLSGDVDTEGECFFPTFECLSDWMLKSGDTVADTYD